LDKFRISSGILRVERGGEKLAGWGGSFLMVDRNNAGRLGAGFISVCWETRWLGHFGGFYVPDPPCRLTTAWDSFLGPVRLIIEYAPPT